jgi:ABC-2 type transport system ATP-binding protein
MDHGKIVILDTPQKLKETLEGDVIVLKSNNNKALKDLLATWLDFTNNQHLEKDTLEVTVPNGKTVMPRIVELANQNNLYIESLVLREPNLEDVFLHYTGGSIREDTAKELHGLSAIHRRAIR